MIPSDCDRAMVYGCCLASFERVQDKKQERAYSLAIAVLVHQTRDVDGMLDWAWQLAKATHQGLSIFYVRVGAANKPHELEPGVDSGPEGCAIWAALSKRVAPWFEEGLADPEISRVVISQITAPAPYRVVLSELERLAPSLLIWLILLLSRMTTGHYLRNYSIERASRCCYTAVKRWRSRKRYSFQYRISI